ncbi:MFS transporter [Leifsonia shinshuensis]|uniref:MFS transporter n=1 Tax=Leifsonia shinshuensis TaxID=150026 RepID=UPI00162ADC6F|nr:MFS transporter [Leifsonia shinshuensis]
MGFLVAVSGRYHRRGAMIAAITLPSIVVSMDFSVLNLALPKISTSLGLDGVQQLWVVDTYGLFIAALLVPAGSLVDSIGARRTLVWGCFAFALVSAASAFSPSGELLIASRGLLGCVGATLMPATLALVRQSFPAGRERTRALAAWSAGFAGGGIAGPLLAGVLLANMWWGAVFLVNVPVMLVVVLMVMTSFRVVVRGTARPVDAASVLLLIVGGIAILFSIKQVFADPGSWPVYVPTSMVALSSLWILVRRQRRLAVPLVDLRLLRHPLLRFGVGVNSATVFAVLGVGFFIPQIFELVMGYGPLQSAGLMIPAAFALIIGTSLASRVRERWTLEAHILVGAVGVVAGVLLLLLVRVDGTAWLISSAYSLQSFGFGVISVVTVDAVLGSVPSDAAGVASGVSETGGELGGALGTSVLGSVALAVYRWIGTGSSTLRSTASERAHARAGLAEALLDPGLLGSRAELQNAYLTGVQAAALAAVAVMLIVVIAVIRRRWRLRRV